MRIATARSTRIAKSKTRVTTVLYTYRNPSARSSRQKQVHGRGRAPPDASNRNRTVSPRLGAKNPGSRNQQTRNGLRFQARQEFFVVAFEMHFSGLSLFECGDWRRGEPSLLLAPNPLFCFRWSVVRVAGKALSASPTKDRRRKP
jgi:hypothetical protein